MDLIYKCENISSFITTFLTFFIETGYFFPPFIHLISSGCIFFNEFTLKTHFSIFFRAKRYGEEKIVERKNLFTPSHLLANISIKITLSSILSSTYHIRWQMVKRWVISLCIASKEHGKLKSCMSSESEIFNLFISMENFEWEENKWCSKAR